MSQVPLRRNHGAYHGETIAIEEVLLQARDRAEASGWVVDTLSCAPGLELLAFRREVAGSRRRVYISAGIHGDEPAGPLAALELLSQELGDGFSFCLLPCLNPTGFPLNRRESGPGHDLNRDYRHLVTPEIRAHARWLEQQPPFDVTFCLHEDWEAAGFYLYELNPDGRPSLAEPMIRAVQKVCPIDMAPVIEGREAAGGIIRPSLDPRMRPLWPEAFYLLQKKTRLSYTLEAPSDFPLEVRVNALAVAVRAALSGM